MKKIYFIILRMFDCESIMLIGLLSVIIIIIILMYQKNNISPSISKNIVENFANGDMDNESFNIKKLFGSDNNQYKDKYDELKKYMEIQGLYPMGKDQDMSKYVLKSTVAKEDRCSDMSKYILKSSVPPPTKCPTINKDAWLRKSELPPNWNKDCPAHPDLTNFVLKSTIPPSQKCPSCICPKVKIDAGLCREPTEEDAIKRGLCKKACPPPDPLTPEKCAGIIKCPEPKPCPPPPKVMCPKCPSIPEPAPCPRPPPQPPCPKPVCPTCPNPNEGSCPKPERCPPSQDCPKCYGVKYVKVPVVKSEPLPNPERQTIFPQDTIKTKLLRQYVPQQPRQPRMLKKEFIPQAAEEDISAPPAMFIENKIEDMYTPSSSIINDNIRNDNIRNDNIRNDNIRNDNIRNDDIRNDDIRNDNIINNNEGTCGPISLNNTHKKFGVLGFNTNS